MERQGSRPGGGGGIRWCRSRTKRRVSWFFWGLLSLVIALCLGSVFLVGLGQPKEELMDYVTLLVGGGGGVVFCALGVYMLYVFVRDVFFPARSGLASSIRSQLPYPEEAPPVEELFAMVDDDLNRGARQFEAVAIGQEWVLGEQATRIDRIRGIFTVDEMHQHHTQTGTRTSRTLQLVLIDDRRQMHTTSFLKPQELKAAADCLALRVPEAVRGTKYLDFWTMDEEKREEFERDFQRRRNLRLAGLRKETDTPQDMILEVGAERTSRVTEELIEKTLRECLERGTGRFTLLPNRPIPAGERQLRAMHVSVDRGTVRLLAEEQQRPGCGPASGFGQRAALEILTAWLRREAPDLTGWELRQVYTPQNQIAPDRSARQRSGKKLSLVQVNGLSEQHTSFTREDVEAAAEGLVDGVYQTVELTHDTGYLWIRADAGDRSDARCTVEATWPEEDGLHFYRTKLTPRQAAAWLLGYPKEDYRPGGRDWKDFTKKVK